MPNCDRCNKPTTVSIMSVFNTETICGACKDDERQAPGYAAARDAERNAVRSGNYNFAGVGLSATDHVFLAERRKARATA